MLALPGVDFGESGTDFGLSRGHGLSGGRVGHVSRIRVRNRIRSVHFIPNKAEVFHCGHGPHAGKVLAALGAKG